MNDNILRELYAVISDRKENPEEGSYTCYLFSQGIDKILKKVGEESTETVIAAMKRDKAELSAEIADLLYHLFVLMYAEGTDYSDVLKVLESRHNCGADTPAREAKPKKNK